MDKEQEKLLGSAGFGPYYCPAWITAHLKCWRCPCNASHCRDDKAKLWRYYRNCKVLSEDALQISASNCVRRRDVMKAILAYEEN